MKEACRPGGDKSMDGDRKEISSGEGYCEEYFPEAEKKAIAQIEKEDREEEERKKKAPCSEFKTKDECPPRCSWGGDKCEDSKAAASPAPAVSSVPAPAPAPKEEEKKEKEAPAPAGKGAGNEDEGGAAAPAPGPASSPSGAAGGAPGTAGKD